MSGWPARPLAECCEIISGATPSTSVEEYWDGSIRWATPKDLSDLAGRQYIDETARRITDAGLNSCATKVLPPQSVLFSSRAPIGLVAINTIPMATNQGFKSLIPKREILDAKYLFYWLRANRTYLDSLGNGATFKEVSKATVSRVQIPLPSLTEQRRIAAILDRIDLLRAKRHESLSCLEALAQSAFVEWFGDPGVASPTWQLARLDQIATVVSGATPRTGVDDYWNGEIRWVTPRDLSELSGIYIAETARRITEAGLRACGATLLPIGAVLFSSRAPIGHTAICSAPMATNQGFKSFIPKPDRLDAHYLLQWLRLRRSYLEGLGTGATFKELSKSAVAQIQVPVPPIDLQRRFSAFSIELESVRSKQQASLSHAEQLYTSVEHRAFRGEL